MGMEGGYSGCGMTPAEAILATDRNRGYDDGMFGGGFMWVFFLFFLLAWGNGGWGGFGGGNGLNGALTRGELCQDMNFQSLENATRGIQQGLCDGFYAMNTTMLQGFNGVQRDLCTGFNGVNQNINQARFDAQQCCCETNRNIDAVRAENYRNTCEITTAIHQEGEQTRALINANTMQDLRDKLTEKNQEVQSRDFQLSQLSQTQSLVNQLKPCPIPAYLSCSPYQSFGPYGPYSGTCGYNGGCGCGCGI